MLTESIGTADGMAASRRKLLRSLIGFGAGYVASQFWRVPSVLAEGGVPASMENASIDTRPVRFTSGDAQIDAYLAVPKGEGRHPAIVVIHDQAGLNVHIRDVTNRLAREGFVTLAPDLLSRAGGIAKTAPTEIAQALGGLPVDQTVLDLQKAYAYLQEHESVSDKSTSSLGLGWGGWRNFLLAGAVDELRSVVVFSSSTPADGLGDIESPVLAHYAQFDFRVTGNAPWTAKTMKQLNKKFTYFIYPKVKADFHNEVSLEYDAAAAQLAWSRTVNFLRRPS